MKKMESADIALKCNPKKRAIKENGYDEIRFVRVYNLSDHGIPEIPAIGISCRKKGLRPVPQPHVHDNLEVCLLSSGMRTNYSDGEWFHLTANDIWINKPGIPHGSALIPNGPSTILYLELAPPTPGVSYLGLPLEEALPFWQAFIDLPVCAAVNDPICTAILERIITLAASPRTRWTTHRLITAIKGLLFSIHSLLLNTPARIIHPGVKLALAEIDSLTGTDTLPAISDLARHAGLSLSHFKACFKRDTGIAPGKYLLSKRLSLARDLIMSQKISVIEVAHRLGFASSQHFATAFKAHFGESPSLCRAIENDSP